MSFIFNYKIKINYLNYGANETGEDRDIEETAEQLIQYGNVPPSIDEPLKGVVCG